MIIDAHAHLSRKPDYMLLEKVLRDGDIEQVWLLDLHGCQLATHDFATPEEILEVSRSFPGIFIPFGYLDLRKTPDDVDRLKEQGFFGLKAYRPSLPYDATEHFPFYERAEAMNMPVLFHTGLIEKCSRHNMGPDLTTGPNTMKPSHLATIAAAFPKLQILGGHLGYPWLAETAQNLYYYENITHDLSGYRKDVEWFIRNLGRKCNDGTAGRYFNDKILFATDALCYGDVAEHRNLLKLIQFWSLFLEMIGGCYYRWGEPNERDKILRGNARKLYETILHKP